MRRRRTIAIHLFFGLLALGVTPAASQPPRIVSFIVGVERYKVDHLNQLSYVGEDALRVSQALREIADVDETRSRMLVADRVQKGPLPEATKLRKELPRADIENALQSFLTQTRTGDTAVIYFGGHGKLQFPGSGVSFLTSNFEEQDFLNAIPMRWVMEEIHRRLRGKNVSVVVLANMCHAGAAGVLDPDAGLPSGDELRRESEVDTRAWTRLAYIPAIDKKTTNENDEYGGSVFVHHLNRALRGADADDLARVTSGTVLQVLRKAVPEIPILGNFDDAIVLGRTGRQESTYRRTLGAALVSLALDNDDNRYLLRLAADQFARASDLWLPTRPINLLSLAEVQLLLGNDSEARTALEDLKRDASKDSDRDVLAQVAALQSTESAVVAQGLSVLLLVSNDEFFTRKNAPASANPWQQYFSSLKPAPLRSRQMSIDVRLRSPTGTPLDAGDDRVWLTEAKKTVNSWRASARAGELLVIVYSGVSGKEGADVGPVGGTDLADLARLWTDRPVVAIFDAPFGGLVKRKFPVDATPNAALWLSASQENGMTFGGAENRAVPYDTTVLMVNAARDGLSPARLVDIADRNRALAPKSPVFDKYPPGMPEWLGPKFPPFWKSTAAAAARRHLLRWAWWADRVVGAGRVDHGDQDLSVEVLNALDAARRAAIAGEWNEASKLLASFASHPRVAVRLAALQETQGQLEAARRSYETYLSTLSTTAPAQPARADNTPELEALAKTARSRQEQFTNGIRARSMTLKPTTPRLHLLSVAVQDYLSPEIGDLASPLNDVDSWERAMAKAYGDRVARYPVLQNPTARSLREGLEAVAAASRDHELIVVMYSGRGLESNGHKYLSGIDSRRTAQRQPSGLVGADSWDLASLLALSEVSKIFAHRDLVMILDAQFSAPAGTRRSPLDKHLASLEQGGADGVEASGPMWQYDAPSVLRRHLYVWWEGRLTEHPAGDPRPEVETVNLRSDGENISPFTAALLNGLSQAQTYRAWLEHASSAMAMSQNIVGRLAFQGPSYRPLMSGGAALDDAVCLVQQVDRVEANANIASNWAGVHDQIWTSTVDRLTRAALLVSLGRVQRQCQSRAEQTDAFKQAIQILDGLRNRLNALSEEGLLPTYLYWHTVALDEGLQDPDQALSIVIETISEHSVDGTSLPVLSERLVQLTERAVSTTAGEKVRRARDALAGLKRDGSETDIAAPLQRLDNMLSEQTRSNRTFGVWIP